MIINNSNALIIGNATFLSRFEMRFHDYYQKEFRYSIEVFPPKTSLGNDQLIEEVRRLLTIHPSYISVTYGALGSARDLTRDIVLKLKQSTDQDIAFHFTCVGSDQTQIIDYINTMQENDIHLMVALRGDVPETLRNQFPLPGGFAFANELVAFVKNKFPDISIAVAGYPEKHIEAKDLSTDLDNLERKVDAGADIIITQLFFANQYFYRFVDQVRKRGIQIPILPGILPVQNLKQVQKFTQVCGAEFPEILRKKLEACGDDVQAMQKVGIDYATAQCADLIKNQVAGIHFYSLNKADAVLQITKSLP